MSVQNQDIVPVPWNASPYEAAWFVLQHVGDGDFASSEEFWKAYGAAIYRIYRSGHEVPFQHNRDDSAVCALEEGWLTRGKNGSLTLRLKTPSWKLEKELSEPAATPLHQK